MTLGRVDRAVAERRARARHVRSQRLPATSRSSCFSKFQSLRPGDDLLERRGAARSRASANGASSIAVVVRGRLLDTASLPSAAISPPTKTVPSYIESASASPALPQMTITPLLHHEAGHVAGVARDQQRAALHRDARPAPRSRRGPRPCRRGSRPPRRCRRCRPPTPCPLSIPRRDPSRRCRRCRTSAPSFMPAAVVARRCRRTDACRR